MGAFIAGVLGVMIILWIISLVMQGINTPYRTMSSQDMEELERKGLIVTAKEYEERERIKALRKEMGYKD